MKQCSSCGAQCASDAAFCLSCGAQISSVSGTAGAPGQTSWASFAESNPAPVNGNTSSSFANQNSAPVPAPVVYNSAAEMGRGGNKQKAITAMILGIAGCFCCAIVGIVGLIMGLTYLKSGEEEGKVFAIVAIATGALSVVWQGIAMCASLINSM